MSLRAAAIAFTPGHPAARTALLGMRPPQEIRENAAAAREDVPAELWDGLAGAGLLPMHGQAT